MKQIKGIQFSDSIGVLYELKTVKNKKTLQETYSALEVKEVDEMLEIMHISYNKAHKDKPVEFEDFLTILEEHETSGLYAISQMYGELVEALMFSGLSPEEVKERKNQIANLMKS